MSALLRGLRTVPGVGEKDVAPATTTEPTKEASKPIDADPDAGEKEDTAPVPGEFEYHSDGGSEKDD
jgi:hypothetical protein